MFGALIGHFLRSSHRGADTMAIVNELNEASKSDRYFDATPQEADAQKLKES